jgi:hypothetical protein
LEMSRLNRDALRSARDDIGSMKLTEIDRVVCCRLLARYLPGFVLVRYYECLPLKRDAIVRR